VAAVKSAERPGIQLRGPERSEGLVSCNARVGRPSEIFGFESRMLCDARQHSWSDFFSIMKCKGEIRMPLASENPVRTPLSHHLPPQTEKRSQYDVSS
jgi:hypothetical protein